MRLPKGSGPESPYAEAVALQEALRARLRLAPLPGDLRFVAGADVSSAWRGDTLWGGLAVCDLSDGLRLVDAAVVRAEAEFPYLPGLLAFREVPVLLKALEALRVAPDVVLVDAHGTAHPRRFGSACHFGVLSGIPAVGCAKSLLCGESLPPRADRGAWSALRYGGEVVGAAVRTRSGVAPVFVSPGHLSDLESAVALVLRCAPRFRIPSPIREAHAAVNEARRTNP